MRAGPKAAVDPSPLPFRSRKRGAERFKAFCAGYIAVPKGKGALRPLRLRPWQTELVGTVLDPDPPPSLAGWMLPRGQGNSALVAALGLYDLMTGAEGASVAVVATDERQAGIVFGAAARMVELHPELAGRMQVYQDRLTVPARGASFQVLPAVPKRLEGLRPDTGDPGRVRGDLPGRVRGDRARRRQARDVADHRYRHPAADWSDSVLADMRGWAAEHPEDETFVWREYSAAGFEDHPVDCRHCWTLANPALGDILSERIIASFLPPKTREATFRRARLCQFAEELADPWLPPRAWDDCAEERPIPDGAEVILALDGSFSQDATALVAAEVGEVPHLDVAGLWEPPPGQPEYRVPILDVEDAIRECCRRWQVRQIVADPFRWARSLQILAADGLPVFEFPQSPQRMTPATTGLYEAVVNGTVTHSGDPGSPGTSPTRPSAPTTAAPASTRSTSTAAAGSTSPSARSWRTASPPPVEPGPQLYWYAA